MYDHNFKLNIYFVVAEVDGVIMEIEELVDEEYVDDNGDPIIQELCDEEAFDELNCGIKMENEDDFIEEILEEHIDDNIIEEDLTGDDDDDEQEALYFCNHCDTPFKDFHAHIKQFHRNQSIVIEEGEEDAFIKKETEDREEFILSDNLMKDKALLAKTCTVCNIVLENASDFREHMRNEHENLIRAEYSCQDCGQTFGYRKEILQHQSETGHANKLTLEEQCINRRFLCGQCDLYFNSFKEYTEHRKECHPEESDKPDSTDKEPAFCHICNTLFPSVRNLT